MSLPLEGVKVLDFTAIMAGPYCTLMLADMGADVTKIETFPEGDGSRRFEPKVNDESYCFAVLNRNKKSVALDMKEARGKEIFMRLAAQTDILVENFRPGVTKKLGIDYEAIKKINPGVIYASISGFGQTGPYGKKGGFDIIAQGMSGIMRMTGEPDGRPAKVGIAMNDIAAGTTALYAILGSYIKKLKTGEGIYLETSLLEAGLAWTYLGIRRLLRFRRTAARDRHAPPPLDTLPGVQNAGRLRDGRRQQRQAVDQFLHAGAGQAGTPEGRALQPAGGALEEHRRTAGRNRKSFHDRADRALGDKTRRGGGACRAGLHLRSGARRSAHRRAQHGDRDRSSENRAHENHRFAGENQRRIHQVAHASAVAGPALRRGAEKLGYTDEEIAALHAQGVIYDKYRAKNS